MVSIYIFRHEGAELSSSWDVDIHRPTSRLGAFVAGFW